MRASARGEGTVIFTAAGGRGITLPWPAVGADVGLPEAFSESFEGEQLARTLEREITERGLTGPEAAAFMRAWSRAFFGVDSPASGATRDQQEAGRESTRRGPRVGPPAALIYVAWRGAQQGTVVPALAHELRHLLTGDPLAGH